MASGFFGRNAVANIFNDVKVATVVVAAGTASKANTADPELVAGLIVGVYPSAGTAADKVLNSVALAADGAVTVTLGGNTTADQTFKVVVRLASGNIA